MTPNGGEKSERVSNGFGTGRIVATIGARPDPGHWKAEDPGRLPGRNVWYAVSRLGARFAAIEGTNRRQEGPAI
jgi:hypothetical protein